MAHGHPIPQRNAADGGDKWEREYRRVEEVLRAAYEYHFAQPASERAIHPYLVRYLSYRIVPRWVKQYLREVHPAGDWGDIGDAGIDPSVDWLNPAIDWGRLSRWLLGAIMVGPRWCLARRTRSRSLVA